MDTGSGGNNSCLRHWKVWSRNRKRVRRRAKIISRIKENSTKLLHFYSKLLQIIQKY